MFGAISQRPAGGCDANGFREACAQDALGLFCTCFAFFLLSRGLQATDPAQAAVAEDLKSPA